MKTRKSCICAAVFATAIFLLPFSGKAQYIGVTCGFHYDNELSGPYSASLNTSLYNPDSSNPNRTWDDWAAQLKQSGVDFVCPNLVGSQPHAGGNPTNIAAFVTALNNQGNVTKLAIFDDNASSWNAQWNDANGFGYDNSQLFDMSDTNNWKYIYDYNYKLFYQAVPDANRFKINGRPVIIIWSGNHAILSNMQGNVSLALTYVRQRCLADFGFNPFIVLSGDFYSNDTTCTNAGIADGEQGWFSPPSSYTLRTRNGATVGVAVPSFYSSIAANHGATLDSGLTNTVGAGALLTLCEGFTDWLEVAAMLRVRNLDTNGASLGYTQTGYDYPNQRINILRKHSQHPFPANLTFEAEGCDTYGGAGGGNGKINYYRNGNIAIEVCSDTAAGWDVGWIQSGEWFEWQGVPLNGAPHFLARVATTNSLRTGHFVIDGVAQPSQTLPVTGGNQTWATYDFGSFGTFTNSYHTVRFVSDNGGISFNWWQESTTVGGPGNGIYKIVNRNSGLALDAKGQWVTNGTPIQQYTYGGGANQQWAVTNLGSAYKIIGVQSERSLDVKGQSTANGAAIQLYDDNGGANQQWVIVPTSGGYNTIQGVQSGKMMEVAGNGTTNGTPVDQWSSTGGNNQQWSFQAP